VHVVGQHVGAHPAQGQANTAAVGWVLLTNSAGKQLTNIDCSYMLYELFTFAYYFLKKNITVNCWMEVLTFSNLSLSI